MFFRNIQGLSKAQTKGSSLLWCHFSLLVFGAEAWFAHVVQLSPVKKVLVGWPCGGEHPGSHCRVQVGALPTIFLLLHISLLSAAPLLHPGPQGFGELHPPPHLPKLPYGLGNERPRPVLGPG